VPRRLGVRAVFNAADEFNAVPAAAMGEASPKSPLEVDPEGGGIVTSMQGAWAEELVAVVPKTAIDPVGG